MAYKSQRKDSVRVVHMGQLFPKVTEEIVALMIELIRVFKGCCTSTVLRIVASFTSDGFG
jgi:hypothetical protein